MAGRFNLSHLQLKRRLQTRSEEIANSISHGIGCAAAIAVTPFLLLTEMERGDAGSIVGVSIFAGSMIVLYLMSTLYHALPRNRAKQVFQVLDHAAIFLLIAGTYTPFTLGVLRGAWGWTLLGIVWSLALAGIVLKAIVGARFLRLSIGLYLGMGWLGLIALRPLWLYVPVDGLLWLLAGGLFYTVGVVFFITERIQYHHLVWHLFVMAGTACHVIAVLKYAA